MASMKLDAVSVVSDDLEKSRRFYELLGFAFDRHGPGDDHIEARTAPDGVRLMIDSRKLVASLTGTTPEPATHSAFAMLCESPAEVNATAKVVEEAGFEIVTPPWDAFWGQRYAVVRDPNGYMIDLFAPLR